MTEADRRRRLRGLSLTGREMAILELVAEGLTNKQIAHRVYLSRHTVRNHLANITAKLEVPNRSSAVRWYCDHR